MNPILFHWIVPAGMKGVAPNEPHQTGTQALKRTVTPDCGYRIFGAGRRETATWGKKGGYTYLVDSNTNNENLPEKLHKHYYAP
jgi:hypothetical protein